LNSNNTTTATTITNTSSKKTTKKRSLNVLDSPTNTNTNLLSASSSSGTNNKTKRAFKRIKRDLNATSLDPEISNLIKSISSNNKTNSTFKESLAFFSSSRTNSFRANRLNSQSIVPKTAYSSLLFG
jgi:hypothetical protein